MLVAELLRGDRLSPSQGESRSCSLELWNRRVENSRRYISSEDACCRVVAAKRHCRERADHVHLYSGQGESRTAFVTSPGEDASCRVVAWRPLVAIATREPVVFTGILDQANREQQTLHLPLKMLVAELLRGERLPPMQGQSRSCSLELWTKRVENSRRYIFQ